jgi:membrane fusion protein (multidrug efflux system)
MNVELRARVPGYITSVSYQEGGPVKAGQVLFTIDPVLAQARVTQAVGDMASAEAALAKATVDVDRAKAMMAANVTSRQEYDNAVAAQELAKAQIVGAKGSLQTAQANLGYTKVVSPIDGIAGFTKVRVGSLVGQGDATLLTTVSQLDPIRTRFTISEQIYLRYAADLQRLVSDKTIEGRLELILADGSVFPQRGKLAVVDRQIDPTTGTITLEALFPNPNNILRPGQFAKVRGAVDFRQGAVLIPQRAVRELQGLTQVLVLGEGNKVELRSVTMGVRMGSHWLVEGGLKPGERIIIEGVQKARPGAPVNPTMVPMPPRTSGTPSRAAGAGSDAGSAAGGDAGSDAGAVAPAPATSGSASSDRARKEK